MTETPGNAERGAAPSLDELARRLLDLWQDQLNAAAANPDIASQAARLMAALPLPGMWLNQMGQMGAQSWNSQSPHAGADIATAWAEIARNWMQQPGKTEGASDEGGTARSAGTAAAGTTTAAAASQPGSIDMDELRARLAGLEKRLGELGAKPKSTRVKSGTKRKPRAAGKRDERAGAGSAKDGSAPADDGTAG